MSDDKYPLAQIMEIKEKRVVEAQGVLHQKKEALKTEEDKLSKAEAERDNVKKHKISKLQQMRKEMDEGTTTDKIIQMKHYLNTVDEKLVVEENKVSEQKKQVQAAEAAVEEAHALVKEKEREVDKLKVHKKEWLKEMQKELALKEQQELDELGSQMFLSNKRKK
jgi:flagellar export protein FliJ